MSDDAAHIKEFADRIATFTKEELETAYLYLWGESKAENLARAKTFLLEQLHRRQLEAEAGRSAQATQRAADATEQQARDARRSADAAEQEWKFTKYGALATAASVFVALLVVLVSAFQLNEIRQQRIAQEDALRQIRAAQAQAQQTQERLVSLETRLLRITRGLGKLAFLTSENQVFAWGPPYDQEIAAELEGVYAEAFKENPKALAELRAKFAKLKSSPR